MGQVKGGDLSLEVERNIGGESHDSVAIKM